ncbi:T9SS type A sorting domain-containing protein [Labilibacter marinus]|uniref:T9SS type A sorting domain-containing protein n=1 Tax=Labilibacter marinus TaxID=1477105 RepID=UPI00094F523D|nr:T9SS type A sorting domain-containing protein [Labilibacter marinus]
MKYNFKTLVLLVIVVKSQILIAQDIHINGAIMDCSCFGSNDGSIYINVMGGTLPYTFHWSTADGSGITQGSSNQYDLSGGSYSVIVTDYNSYSISETYTINEPSDIVINSIIQDESCIGCQDGSISVEVDGGTGIYQMIWAGPLPLSGNINTELVSGEYYLYVRDENMCSKEVILTVETRIPTKISSQERDINFKVYPNPVTTKLNVVNNKENLDVFVELFNMAGTKLETRSQIGESCSFDMAGYKNGTYLVKIILKDNSYIYKIVKK